MTNGTLDGIDLENLIQKGITIDSHQNISSIIFFMNATFNQINEFESINNLNRNYFDQVIKKDSRNVDVYLDNLESLLGYWYVKELHVDGLLNTYNITDINRRALKKHSAIRQTITAKHIYLRPINILNLELPIDHVEINEVPIQNYVWLHSPTLRYNLLFLF